ncbi:hypothetical protein VPZ60_004279 [Salmonella enterica]|nr:hypothetical protein [Salmonella enterica]
MRQPKPTDFYIDVPEVGRFRIAKRSLMLEMEIQREYASFAGGVDPTAWLVTLAEYLSTLRVLIVESPDSWDMDNMDPLDEDTYEKIGKVFFALREREETFRGNAGTHRKAAGAADGEHGGPLVSPDVQAAPEQPAVPGNNV